VVEGEENSVTRKKIGLRPTQERRIIMTNREFFEAVKNGIINEEVVAHAIAEIDKMNARNKKRASKPSKTAIANEPIKAQILEFLTEKNEPILTSVIGEAVEISTAKAAALCKQLSEDGKIVGEEKKIPKIGKRIVWSIKKD